MIVWGLCYLKHSGIGYVLLLELRFVSLMDVILYVPVNNFSVMLGRVLLG